MPRWVHIASGFYSGDVFESASLDFISSILQLAAFFSFSLEHTMADSHASILVSFSVAMERRSVIEPELGQPRGMNLVPSNRTPPSKMACLHKLRRLLFFWRMFPDPTSNGDLWKTNASQSSLHSLL